MSMIIWIFQQSLPELGNSATNGIAMTDYNKEELWLAIHKRMMCFVSRLSLFWYWYSLTDKYCPWLHVIAQEVDHKTERERES